MRNMKDNEAKELWFVDKIQEYIDSLEKGEEK